MKLLERWWSDFRGHGRLRKQAWTAIFGRRFEQAKQLIDHGCRKFPKSSSFQILQARYALLSNDHESAARLLVDLSDVESLDMYDLFEVAETNRLLRRYADATQQFERLIDIGKLDLPVLANQRLSSIYSRLGQAEKALEASVRCILLGGWQRQAVSMQLGKECSPASVDKAIKRLSSRTVSHVDGEVERLKFIAYLAAGIGRWDPAIESISLATKRRFTEDYGAARWVASAKPLRPSILVIGAMKSGTSSLFDQLVSHPQFVAPLSKELHFFENREWPDEFYFAHFPRVDESSGLVTGEASPGYYALDILDRVQTMLPHVRLVFVQRNPVARAISHLFHNRSSHIQEHSTDVLRRGQSPIFDLCGLDEEELLAQLRRIETGELKINRYLLLGCYELLMKSWRRHFGEERLLELSFDEFVQHPQETMGSVFEFVGLTQYSIDHSRKSNAGTYRADAAELVEIKKELERFYQEVDRLEAARET